MDTNSKIIDGQEIHNILSGFVCQIRPARISVIRKNRYQTIFLAEPIFKKRTYLNSETTYRFQSEMNYYDIAFFGDDFEDLEKDFKVGDFVRVKVKGNERSTDGEIDKDSFIVGKLITKDYLFNDKIKTKLFFDKFLKYLYQ